MCFAVNSSYNEDVQMDTKGALHTQPGCAEKCFCSNYSLVLGIEGEREAKKTKCNEIGEGHLSSEA